MINIYKLNLTNLQQEILRLLYVKAGTILNARRISKYLEVSPPAVSKSLPLLEKESLIKINKDKESKRFSIELNRDNQKVIWLKRADNLKQIYESGFAKFIYDSFPGATIILFGSYSSGEDTLDSDIDLAIIGTKERIIDLTNFERILEREIIINYYPSLKDIKIELRNNIMSGIVLKGAIE